jgi:UDPglucose 6-dehydrogenase
MNIAVIGSGYVGLVAAACFAEIGHSVICVDNDPEKLRALMDGATPIHEEHLPELLARHRGHRLRFSGSITEAVQASSAIFIAVGTPPLDNGDADLSYVEAVAREIAESLDGYKVVVEKSTVPVYTSTWVRRVMQLTAGTECDFDVVSIVVGADSERSAKLLREIYAPLTTGVYYEGKNVIVGPPGAKTPPRLIATSAKSAELIKHASNAFLALKISFINAVANVCEAVNADIEEVALGIGTDSRIGRRFLRAGIGYGGSCFPKDVAAFRSVARESGYDFSLLDSIIAINDEQRERFIRRVRSAVWTLRGKRLAVLGLSFKGGTDDIRESPAIAIIQTLLDERCSVIAFDPAGMERAKPELRGDISYAGDAYEAASGADALLILTDWEEFATLDLARVRKLLRYPIVIDGRNLYSPAEMERHGFNYVSIGRPVVQASTKKVAAGQETLSAHS